MRPTMTLKAVLFAMVLSAGAGQANASTIVYTNGPILGTTYPATISDGFARSNSFFVSSATNLISADAGLLILNIFQIGTPLTVDWSIGTTPFASDVSSGTSALTNTSFGTALGFYDVYNSAFAISGSVGVGTYFFTLQGATSTSGFALFWDLNNGPSTAFSRYGSNNPVSGASSAFTLYSGSPVPEPSTWLLLGTGLAAVAARRRYTKRT